MGDLDLVQRHRLLPFLQVVLRGIPIAIDGNVGWRSRCSVCRLQNFCLGAGRLSRFQRREPAARSYSSLRNRVSQHARPICVLRVLRRLGRQPLAHGRAKAIKASCWHGRYMAVADACGERALHTWASKLAPQLRRAALCVSRAHSHCVSRANTRTACALNACLIVTGGESGIHNKHTRCLRHD